MADIVDFEAKRRDRQGNEIVSRETPERTYTVEVSTFETGNPSALVRGLPKNIGDQELIKIADELIACALSIGIDVSSRLGGMGYNNEQLLAMVRVYADQNVVLSFTDNDPTAEQIAWIGRLAASAGVLFNRAMMEAKRKDVE